MFSRQKVERVSQTNTANLQVDRSLFPTDSTYMVRRDQTSYNWKWEISNLHQSISNYDCDGDVPPLMECADVLSNKSLLVCLPKAIISDYGLIVTNGKWQSMLHPSYWSRVNGARYTIAAVDVVIMDGISLN